MSKNATTSTATAAVILPTAQELNQINDLSRDGWKTFDHLILSMSAVLEKKNGLTTRDRKAVWAQAEEAFLAKTGSTWRELLAELANETAREAEQAAQEAAQEAAQPVTTEGARFGYPHCLPVLSQEGRDAMEAEYMKADEFQAVPARVYGQLFKGAASSRRHGIKASEWMRRIHGADNRIPRRLLLLVAFRAYSAPVAQICGA